MSSNTKIVVLRSKELIYTIVLLTVGIMILIILLSIFLPGDDSPALPESEASYIPGIYSSSLQLSNMLADLEVTVDANQITSISLINLDEAVTTMYPLMEPTLEELSEKILETQSLDNITYTDESKYTSIILLNAITSSLDKALISNHEPTE